MLNDRVAKSYKKSRQNFSEPYFDLEYTFGSSITLIRKPY